MRELKFRAWDKRYKRMSQPFGIGGDISCLVYFPEENGKLDSILIEVVACEKERFVIMQYTGLKDLEGREIYEGDIIGENKEVFGIVVWDKANARFAVKFDNYVDASRMSIYDWMEHWKYRNWRVIGNIYQNPEILGGK